MAKKKSIVCAVELATSKIGALIAEVLPDGTPEITGWSMKSAEGSVVKGEIVNVKKASQILNRVLDEADKRSGNMLDNCHIVAVPVTGCAIASQQCQGIVHINPGAKVQQADCDEAFCSAGAIMLDAERQKINTVVSHYLLDKRHVTTPVDMVGRNLESWVHVVHGQCLPLENFSNTIREYSRLENVHVEMIFAPIACGLGVVDDPEGEKGVILIDIGAGTTEYLVSRDNGICGSGVIQVGMEHVANDLSIGLKLPIQLCRTILENGTLQRASAEGKAFLEITGTNNTKRKISVSSCEIITEARIREIFEIIRKELIVKNLPAIYAAGGVLTGGGSLFFQSKTVFENVFQIGCRIASPGEISGKIPEMNSPRFSALWGTLLRAAQFAVNEDTSDSGSGVFHKLMNWIQGNGAQNE